VPRPATGNTAFLILLNKKTYIYPRLKRHHTFFLKKKKPIYDFFQKRFFLLVVQKNC